MSSASARRGYRVPAAQDARRLARREIRGWPCAARLTFGLPEVDDRYDVWRVALLAGDRRIGEIVIDAHTGQVQRRRSTGPALAAQRLALEPGAPAGPAAGGASRPPAPADAIVCGDAEHVLGELPAGSAGLVFTSPPYYNARPDYTDYVSYDAYLAKMRAVIAQAHRVLAEGRFFVLNVAPVLLRRASRREASRRVALPFDLHALLDAEGFEFVDDIVWEKPAAAGWATNRGRRFAADRTPLQYKAVPVTEYVLVYRRASDRLIDWNIRSHPDQAAVERSKIAGDYERTNVWRIRPASSPDHPAVFPLELAERVVRYWSFEGDVVLDPFAGIGTTAQAAARHGRRYLMVECNPAYVEVMRRRLRRS